MTPRPDLAFLDWPEKDALSGAPIARIDALVAENPAPRTRVGEREAKLGRPPKTPDHARPPPAPGRKPSDAAARTPKGKPHAGAHRPPHPNPPARRDMTAAACRHCGADVSGGAQIVRAACDRVAIPEIKPDIARATPLRTLPVVCEKVQGHAAAKAGTRLALRAEPARIRRRFALRARHLIRAAGEAFVR